MINKIKKQLEKFHKELSEAFENSEKMEQLYATNIKITMGSQTFELPFAPDTVEIVTEALCYNIFTIAKVRHKDLRTSALDPSYKIN